MVNRQADNSLRIRLRLVDKIRPARIRAPADSTLRFWCFETRVPTDRDRNVRSDPEPPPLPHRTDEPEPAECVGEATVGQVRYDQVDGVQDLRR